MAEFPARAYGGRMGTHLFAALIGSAVGYLPVLIFGDRMSFMTSFFVSSIAGGVAYVYAFYKLKQLRGEL